MAYTVTINKGAVSQISSTAYYGYGAESGFSNEMAIVVPPKGFKIKSIEIQQRRIISRQQLYTWMAKSQVFLMKFPRRFRLSRGRKI